MLVEYLDKLKGVGLNIESAAVTSKTAITKRKVVQCLQQIHQPQLAGILRAKHGESGVVCSTCTLQLNTLDSLSLISITHT